MLEELQKVERRRTLKGWAARAARQARQSLNPMEPIKSMESIELGRGRGDPVYRQGRTKKTALNGSCWTTQLKFKGFIWPNTALDWMNLNCRYCIFWEETAPHFISVPMFNFPQTNGPTELNYGRYFIIESELTTAVNLLFEKIRENCCRPPSFSPRCQTSKSIVIIIPLVSGEVVDQMSTGKNWRMKRKKTTWSKK